MSASTRKRLHVTFSACSGLFVRDVLFSRVGCRHFPWFGRVGEPAIARCMSAGSKTATCCGEVVSCCLHCASGGWRQVSGPCFAAAAARSRSGTEGSHLPRSQAARGHLRPAPFPRIPMQAAPGRMPPRPTMVFDWFVAWLTSLLSDDLILTDLLQQDQAIIFVRVALACRPALACLADLPRLRRSFMARRIAPLEWPAASRERGLFHRLARMICRTHPRVHAYPFTCAGEDVPLATLIWVARAAGVCTEVEHEVGRWQEIRPTGARWLLNIRFPRYRSALYALGPP